MSIRHQNCTRPTPERRSPTPARLGTAIGGITLLVLIADHASKAAAYTWATPHTEVDVGFAGVVRPLNNHDFGLELFGAARAQALLLVASVLVIATALAVHAVSKGQISPTVVGIGTGGALANAIDRAIGGGVADFLVIGPVVANVADMAVLFCVVTVLRNTLPGLRIARPASTKDHPGGTGGPLNDARAPAGS